MWAWLVAGAALAGDGLRDGVGVGVGAMGIGLGSGLAVGVPAALVARGRCDPDPRVSHGSCQPGAVGALGFAAGSGTGAVVAGAALAPVAGRRAV